MDSKTEATVDASAEATSSTDDCCGCGGCASKNVDPAVAAREELLRKVDVLNQWAFQLLQDKQHAAARRLLSAGSVLHDIAGGGHSQSTVWLHSVRAFICSSEGKHSAARRHTRAAMKISRVVDGSESPQYGCVINNAAEILMEGGRTSESEKLLVKGIGLLNKSIADGSVDVAWAVRARSDALSNYRRLLRAAGRDEEADALAE